MGRLRDDYECALFNSVSEEVVDLFGVDGVRLFKHNAADNITGRDPLWDEPSPHVKYKEFEIKALWLDWKDDPEPGAEGFGHTWENTIYVALTHLLKAGAPLDDQNDYVSEGDMIFVFNGNKEFYYDVISVERAGWINDSSQFTGYNLTVKRNRQFYPERKLGS